VKNSIARSVESVIRHGLDVVVIIVVYNEEGNINLQPDLPFLESYCNIGLVIGFLDDLNMFRGVFDNFFKKHPHS
jgi:hypothetical protein